MTLRHRIGALGAAGVMVALATAAPTPADPLVPPADGYYSYAEPGQPPAKWIVQSVCSQASGTREQSDYTDTTIQTLGCVVNVTSSTTPQAATQDEKLLTWGARSRLADGQWTAEPAFPNGQVCDDGRTAPLQQRFQFSEATLTGTRTTVWGDECGNAPHMTKAPFTLTFVGPLEPPTVERFPMECDYLAGRPSICS